MKKHTPLLLVTLGLIFLNGHSQVAGSGPSLWESTSDSERNIHYQLNKRDSLERWEERVYMHTDREQFTPGEHVFFKAYVVNRKTKQRWSPSGVLKLELRDADNKVVNKQYHALNDGVSEGAFKLSGKIDEGTYQLVAYTRWMQNYGENIFFNKTIQIGATNRGEKEDAGLVAEVAFFPEGGKLLSGITNRMVIYGKSNTGNPVPFEAIISDATENSSLPINSYGQGMGQVTFIPSADKSYVLRLMDGREFPLPEVQKAGYTLKINNLDPQEVFVQSERQGMNKSERIFVQGWIDNKPCFENELSYNEEGIAKLEVSKSGLPTGKVDFRLVDESGLRLAERPVWITAADQLEIQIEKVDGRKGKSDEHTFKVTVKDQFGQPVQTDLSLSVRANAVQRSTINKMDNLRTQRFLQDLKVFSKAEVTDLDSTYPDEIVYPIQRGLEIMGYAYDLNNELLVNEDIQLLGVSDSLWIAREISTDSKGLLRIQDLDFEGDTQVIFRAKGEDTRERLVKLVPLSEATIKRQKNKTTKKKKIRNLVLETTPWQPIDTTGLIELDPATIMAVKKQKQEYSSMYQSMISSQDIIVQDPASPKDLLQLINELPGVNVVGIGSTNPRIQILRRGGPSVPGPPLWVLDGIPLNQTTSPNMPTNLFVDTAVGLVPLLSIDRVEFLFGPAAAMFGTRGAAGVFLIYTRDGADSDYIRRKDGQLKFKGFTPKPNIDQVLRQQLKKSKRKNTPYKTLFWNPNLQTDDQGEVMVQFDAPAHVEQMELHVESITARGLKGSQTLVSATSR